jgi:hypothetical protein
MGGHASSVSCGVIAGSVSVERAEIGAGCLLGVDLRRRLSRFRRIFAWTDDPANLLDILLLRGLAVDFTGKNSLQIPGQSSVQINSPNYS